MSKIFSFDPVSRHDARILILGSMPGEMSLEMQQYYAHPRNAFWETLLSILGAKPNLSYEQKLQILKENRIALWDVLQHCERSGSLDSNIDVASEHPNNLSDFLRQHPKIHRILFNGQKAFQSFRRHQLKTGLIDILEYELLTVPSTSPANASITKAMKISLWSAALSDRLEQRPKPKANMSL